jgi:thymidylate synthase
MITRYENFTQAYRRILGDLLTVEPGASPRGEQTREVIAAQFLIENPRDLDLHCDGRRWSEGYFAGELCWYLSGSEYLAPIAAYSKFWNKMSDDGETVRSAYGKRMFSRDAATVPTKFEQIVAQLQSDAESRRAVVTLLHPGDALDGPDVPCTISLQFLLRNDALHLIVTMRSNDIWFGVAYDVPAFCTFQSLIASRLGVGVGKYIHQAGSLHLYERDVKRAVEALARPDSPCRGWLDPRWDEIQIGELLYYEHCLRDGRAAQMPMLDGFWYDVANVLERHWAVRRES